MTLFWELFLTEFVKDIELLRKGIILRVTNRGKFDLDNNLSVRYHHTDRTEEDLQVFRKFLSTSISRIHSNEITTGLYEENGNWFIREHELFEVLLFGLGNCFNLCSHHRESSKRNSVEFIKATPKTTLTDTFENLCHVSVFVFIRAVCYHYKNT